MDSRNEEFDEEDEEKERGESSELGERTDHNKFSSIWDSKRNKKKYKADKGNINESQLIKEIIQSSPEDKKKYVMKSADKQFGRFDEEIGFGSFKRVFRGFDFNEGREVAWNTISIIGMGEEELERIRKEVNIMKKVNHPSIINYISGWCNDLKNEMVIITEMLCGGSLKKYLNKIGYPRLRLVKHWVKDILRGLKYLHTEIVPPIVHRDIKCDNLFIDTTRGAIKIGDLGLSKIQNSNYANSYVGTEEFMAPEVYQGKYTVLADIYSLGITILEMVTLEKPYKECDSNILKIYECAKNHIMPKCLNRIKNEELKNFILLCLKPESERSSAKQLLEMPFLNDMESEENNRPVDIIRNDNFDICRADQKNILIKSNSKMMVSNFKKEDDKQYSKTAQNNENTNYYIINSKSNPSVSNLYSSTKMPKTSSQSNIFNINASNSIKKVNSLSSLIIEERIESMNEKVQIVKSPFTLYKNDLNKISVEDLYSLGSDSIKKSNTGNMNFIIPKHNSKSIERFSNEVLTKGENNFSSNIHTNNTKSHKVSLKNSLNKRADSFSQFEIKILESPEIGITENNTSNFPGNTFNPTLNETEIQIVFNLHKAEWQKGKKIKFNYHLNNDTKEGVVLELKKAIDLTDEEYKIILVKLSDFLSKFQQSKTEKKNEQKYSLEGGGSTTPDVDLYTKEKKTIEIFLVTYNKLLNKINKLMQDQNTQLLDNIKSKFENPFNHKKNFELEKIIKEYAQKSEQLSLFLKRNSEPRNTITEK